MDLSKYRNDIDQIDEQLVALFIERMHLSRQIAELKKEYNMPICVPDRERNILKAVAELAGPELADYTKVLYSIIFELSRSYQGKCNRNHSKIYKQISDAIDSTPQLFPTNPTVACQGVEGAFSQIACEKIFKDPFPVYFKNMDAVFQAVDNGLCEYGVLPIENSAGGSVKKVYDLLIQHNFSIVRTCHLKTDHNLLANRGTEISQIKEIYSHQNAIAQCSHFLKKHPTIKIIPVENTAVAAELVARSSRNDVAALANHVCEELYGLISLADAVQDKMTNRTHFICFSKRLEIYPGADKTSIMMVLPHKPGSLYKVLARLFTLGINITKLESRPIPERDYDFMFYFDLETSIYSEEYIQLMCELDDICSEFKYLGSYTEVVS